MDQRKQTIVFYVCTEYQLYLAINIILSEFSDSRLYHRVILQGESLARRLSQLKLDTRQPFIDSYHRIVVDELDFSFSRQLKRDIDSLLLPNIHHFFFFGGGDYVSRYLISKFGDRVRISHSEDGLREYSKRKHSLAATLRVVIRAIQFSIAKQMKQRWYTPEIPPSLKFHSEWLTHPELVNERTCPLRQIHITTNSSILRRIFCGVPPPLDNSVVFFNQPSFNEGLNVEELLILQELSRKLKAQDRTLFIKLHPLTLSAQAQRYATIDNVQIVSTTVLSELFMDGCTNSVFLGWWSTVLLHTTPANRNIWMYPILEKKNIIKKPDFRLPADVLRFDNKDQLVSYVLQTLVGNPHGHRPHAQAIEGGGI